MEPDIVYLTKNNFTLMVAIQDINTWTTYVDESVFSF